MSSPSTIDAQRHDLHTMLELWWPCGSWQVDYDVAREVFVADCKDMNAPDLPPMPTHDEARKGWFAVFAHRNGLV